MNEEPTPVITIEINNVKYTVDLIAYNANILEGKTEYITVGDCLHMVTPELAKELKKLESYLNVRKA